MTNSQEKFAARLAEVRAAISQRHAERKLKADADKAAAERRVALKAQRRADTEAAAKAERDAAREALATEQRRQKLQDEVVAREAARPKASTPDSFPKIPGARWVRGTMGRETWNSLHMFAQRKALGGLMTGATPVEIERARRLLDMAADKDHLRANVRQTIFERAQRGTSTT